MTDIFKICYQQGDGNLSSGYVAGKLKAIYPIGTVVYPPIKGSKLFAFATVEDAQAYLDIPNENDNIDGVPIIAMNTGSAIDNTSDYMRVFEAIGTNVTPAPVYIPSIFSDCCASAWKDGELMLDTFMEYGKKALAPAGTVLCDTIQLVEEIKGKAI